MTTVPAEQVEQAGRALVVQATAMTVTDGPSFRAAGEFLVAVKGYIRRVRDLMDPVVDAANKAHKVAVAQRASLLSHAEGAERMLKARMAEYEREQDRRRREAEAAARAEQARLEREARERQATEVARLRKEEEDRRIAAAAAAEARGVRAAAEKIIEAPIVVPAPPPVPVFVPPVTVERAPEVEGVSFRDTYRAEVTDLAVLVQAVAAGQQPITLLRVNDVALNQMARALREAMSVPGVRVVKERTVAARA
jgi:hypothetical protein